LHPRWGITIPDSTPLFRNREIDELEMDTTELIRPWKLATLAIGIGLLVVGSFYYDAPDWDIPISIVMALMAYLTASWSMHVMVERRWRQWPLMLFWTWFTVDGCYWLYWHFKNPVALELMRDANAPASLSLYWTCGLIWYYRGTLREIWVDLKRTVNK
jgi:hypothetical protein